MITGKPLANLPSNFLKIVIWKTSLDFDTICVLFRLRIVEQSIKG